MQVFRSISDFETSKPVVATMGMYDGVHLGHQAVLQQVMERARTQNASAVLVSFWPHPRQVLQPDSDLKLLQTPEEKIQILEQIGMDALVLHPFDKAFSRLTSIEFVRDMLVAKLGITEFIVGHDHQFGRNREGGFETLSELAELYDFSLVRLPAVEKNSDAISSTKIRKALGDADLTYVKMALGRNYSLTGEVVGGIQLARKLGFPTANLALNPKKMLPKYGVYAVRVYWQEKRFLGVMNVGEKPTLEHTNAVFCEVHIFDFDQNIYAQKIEVEVIAFLRSEQRFDSHEELAKQIAIDSRKAKAILEGI